jgi:fatty-acid desaturase
MLSHLILLIFSGILVASFAAIGVTGGAHRLWAHRAYKAKWPMRVILMLLQTTAFQVRLLAMLLYELIYAKHN